MNSNYNFSDRQIPLINLLGEEMENFYQLGNKDKSNWEKVKNSTGFLIDKSLMAPLNKGIFYLLRKNFENLNKNDAFFIALESYSKGLECDPFDIYSFIITGEVFSTSGPWPKSYPRNYTYSSSLYFRTSNSGKVILIKNWEGPFSSKVSHFLRLNHTHFYQKPDSFYLSYPGHPFPYHFVTLKNGLQISAHQMISDTLEIKGKSLAQILYEIQLVNVNIEDLKDYFLSITGLSSSLFTICLNQKSILEVYLNGAAVNFKHTNIEDDKLRTFSSKSDFSEHFFLNNDYEYGIEKFSSRTLKNVTNLNSDIDALRALCLPDSKEVNPFSYMNPFNSF
ncbi:MAG: hypothetical protein OEY33_03610, partial [Bdellovibrionales bacterium]|nr:hypothetical protein [Bdellovibrionales bacterium]